MRKSKKGILLIFVLILLILALVPSVEVSAESITEDIYSIFGENGEKLLQKQEVYVGDNFLTSDFKKYEITELDEINKIGKAKFIEFVEKPKVDRSFTPSNISQLAPVICMYMTHNDESYLPTDGYDSIYGKGGIHNVAKALVTHFEQKGVTTHISEELHIPHDSYAYSRSKNTAKKLIEDYNPDGIFDIHRDGASRSTYVKNINGAERCKIRIVVGKSSDNFKVAEQFALYLLSVAEEVCPWLFLDIYYAGGHYNQGLHDKALLFEMGSHLVEKELVLKSVEPLVNVITTAMFQTTVDNNTGNLTINGPVTEDTPLINDALTEIAKEQNNEGGVPLILSLVLGGSLLVVLVTITNVRLKGKNKNK